MCIYSIMFLFYMILWFNLYIEFYICIVLYIYIIFTFITLCIHTYIYIYIGNYFYIFWDVLCSIFVGIDIIKISPYFITLLYWVSKPKVVPLRSIPALSPVRFMVQVQFLDETYNWLAGKITGNHCFPFSPSKKNDLPQYVFPFKPIPWNMEKSAKKYYVGNWNAKKKKKTSSVWNWMQKRTCGDVRIMTDYVHQMDTCDSASHGW